MKYIGKDNKKLQWNMLEKIMKIAMKCAKKYNEICVEI
jgi:hypothetical protein